MARVLLAHKHFAPDSTNYALMLDVFAQHLAGLGHEVHIFAGEPSYHNESSASPSQRLEHRDGVTIHRMRLPLKKSRFGKTLSNLSFPVGLIWHSWTRPLPYDTVSVTTIPPVVMGLAGRAATARSRRSELVYHCMDLYPEAAQALGLLRSPPLADLARWLDTWTMRSAKRTIVLSSDMARTVASRGDGASGVTVCNNFVASDHHTASSLGAAEEWTSGKFRIIFAGNVGRFQGLDTVLAAIELLSHRDDFELIVLGNGTMADDIARHSRAKSLPIKLLPHRAFEDAAGLIATADLALVPLAPGVIDAAYPSKTLTYLDLNVPVLAVVEPGSELSSTLVTSGCGIAADNADPGAVAAALARAIEDPPARPSGRSPFNRTATLERWTELYHLGEAA